MIRAGYLVLVSAVAAPLAVGACAHEKKLAASTPAPSPHQARALPPPAAAKPAPMTVFADAAKNKERDDAIYFDFDSALLRDDARPVLEKVADSARAGASRVEIDGNCDEVGTTEYNLALGDERARAAKDYLVHLGVSADRIKTVSYGAERPRFSGHDEGARAKNRRDDLTVH